MRQSEITRIFEDHGGQFVTPLRVLAAKAHKINTLIFDWDGVFHSGQKDQLGQSGFSEVDSMGVNMLRFGIFLQTGKVPFTAIFTGESNPTAQAFAKREHFDMVVLQAKDKWSVFEKVKSNNNLKTAETAFFFDDILDLSLAREVELRFVLRRQANPLFSQYVVKNKLADYGTAHEGGQHGLREACEVFLAAIGKFEDTLTQRTQMSEAYQTYWALRNKQETQILEAKSL
jgi:3-deoxy-D-manno-octulosonate 8-phosphate phosphatase (KDO 8-P phosphatase)